MERSEIIAALIKAFPLTFKIGTPEKKAGEIVDFILSLQEKEPIDWEKIAYRAFLYGIEKYHLPQVYPTKIREIQFNEWLTKQPEFASAPTSMNDPSK